jgi:ankyrin repeat protein
MTWSKLHAACERQDTALVLRLSQTNSEDAVEVDDHQATPLHVFCLSPSDPLALQALLEACPHAATDQDIHGDTPLHVCCRSPSATKHMVQMLLDAAPVSASMCNREGLMPLHVACRHAPTNAEVIGLLIDVHPFALRHRIKMGSLATKGRTSPLVERKKNDHPFIDPANSGMKSKGSVDLRFRAAEAQVRDGAYPMHMAIGAGAPLHVVEMLLKQADDILTQPNKFGETPLMIALMRSHEDDVADEELVRVLISACPDAVRLCDKKGNLPIHVAVMFGATVHTIKDLLEQWPDMIHETNGVGLTASDLAVQSSSCSEQILHLLTCPLTEDHTA